MRLGFDLIALVFMGLSFLFLPDCYVEFFTTRYDGMGEWLTSALALILITCSLVHISVLLVSDVMAVAGAM